MNPDNSAFENLALNPVNPENVAKWGRISRQKLIQGISC